MEVRPVGAKAEVYTAYGTDEGFPDSKLLR